jgi:hypothetical protein
MRRAANSRLVADATINQIAAGACSTAIFIPVINPIERLHEEFKRSKTQTVLPSANTAVMLFWALLASGQINTRKVDGWQMLASKPPLTSPPETIPSFFTGGPATPNPTISRTAPICAEIS